MTLHRLLVLVVCVGVHAGDGNGTGFRPSSPDRRQCAGDPIRVVVYPDLDLQPYTPSASASCWAELSFASQAASNPFAHGSAAACVDAERPSPDTVSTSSDAQRYLLDWYALPATPEPLLQSKLRCAAGSEDRICDVRLTALQLSSPVPPESTSDSQPSAPTADSSPATLPGTAVHEPALRRLILTFDVDTDTPRIDTASALLQFVEFSGLNFIDEFSSTSSGQDVSPPAGNARVINATWDTPSQLSVRFHTEPAQAGTQVISLGGKPITAHLLLVELAGLRRRGGTAASLSTVDFNASVAKETQVDDADAAVILRAMDAAGPPVAFPGSRSAVALKAADAGNYSMRLCRSSALHSECRRGLVTGAAELDALPADSVGSQHLTTAAPVPSSCECEVLASASVQVRDCHVSRTLRLPPSSTKLTTDAASARRKPASETRPAPTDDVEMPRQQPTWSLKGVAAVGAKGLRIPHGSLPSSAQASGSWSMSMWMWVWGAHGGDLSTGQNPSYNHTLGNGVSYSSTPFKPSHRVLFFKGPGGQDQQRTPSAWLSPDSERLVLRASTDANPDLGSDSVGALPVREWVHVAFTFENHTHAFLQQLKEYTAHKQNDTSPASSASVGDLAQPQHPPVSFSYKVYVNGHLDSGLSYNWPSIVVGNTGPLWIGKSPDFSGVTSLIARLSLFEGVLDDAQIQAEFEHSRMMFRPRRERSGGDDTAAGDAGRQALPADVDPSEFHTLQGVIAAATIASTWGGWYWPKASDDRGASAHSLLQRLRSGRDGSAFLKAAAAEHFHGNRADNPASTHSNPCIADSESESCAAQRRKRHVVDALRDLEDREDEAPAVTAASCTSAAELEAWKWSLEYHDIAFDPALGVYSFGRGGSGGGHGAPSSTDDVEHRASTRHVDYGSEWMSETQDAFKHASAVLANCGIPFQSDDTSAEDISREVADSGLEARMQSNDSLSDAQLEQQSPAFNNGRNRRFYHSYQGAISLLASASAGGTGHPVASRLLADYLMQPGRDTCAEEFRKLGTKLSVHSALDQRSNADSMSTIANVLAGPFLTGGRLITDGLRYLGIVADPTNSSVPSSSTKAPAHDQRPASRWQRDTQAARKLYAAAAMRGDASALYGWGISILLGTGSGSVVPHASTGHSPSAFDTSFAIGLIHLAAAAGEPTAWQFLAKRYSKGEGGLHSIPAFANPVLDSASLSGGRDVGGDHASGSLARRVRGAQAVVAGLDVPGVSSARAAAVSTASASISLLERFFSTVSAGVPKDTELAAWYAEWAADVADATYHAPSGRPLYETQRLTVDAADSGEVEKHQRGDDDAAIAFQRMKADQGDVTAMMATADLLYWGARGVQRDHARALQYYRRAAAMGHVDAMVASGAMLLKGEGDDKNFTAAIEYYEQAGSLNNTKALNGLGYAHYFGHHGVQQNFTRAFEYFQTAADQGTDSDSLFNAGRCLQTGTGTVKNLTRAKSHYESCVRMGHFDCVQSMGRIYAHGATPVMKWKLLPQEPETADDTQQHDGESVDQVDACDAGDDDEVALHDAVGNDTWPISATAAETGEQQALNDRGLVRQTDGIVGSDDGLPRYREQQPAQRKPARHPVRSSKRSCITPSPQRHPRPSNSTNDTATTSSSSRTSEPSFIHLEEESLVRNADQALAHLEPAASFGPWAALVRRGFERYLVRDYDGALLHYLHAYLLGWEVGAANAAYLLHRRLADLRRLHMLPLQSSRADCPVSGADAVGDADYGRQRLAYLLYQYSYARGGSDALLPLADYSLHGIGAGSGSSRSSGGGYYKSVDVHTAMALYARASASGSAQAAFSLGSIYECGAGPVAPDSGRAERYYRRVLELTPADPAQAPVYFALARMRARAWMDSVLLALTGIGWDEWWSWMTDMQASTAGPSSTAEQRDAGHSTSYWRSVETLQSSWSMRVFEWIVGDPSPNSQYERKGDAVADEYHDTRPGSTSAPADGDNPNGNQSWEQIWSQVARLVGKAVAASWNSTSLIGAHQNPEAVLAVAVAVITLLMAATWMCKRVRRKALRAIPRVNADA